MGVGEAPVFKHIPADVFSAVRRGTVVGAMPSDFLTPFLELEEFCKSQGLEDSPLQTLKTMSFQRHHSHCPATLNTSLFNSSEVEGLLGLSLGPQQRWSRELPRSALSHIPFRVDRSVSMIEGPPLQPPPGLTPTTGPHTSARYKTELCRTYQESGVCKYGAKCQFAHGSEELRGLSRHPKYKTEPCRTFHTIGFCPYGARCHFIHNADELCPEAQRRSGAPRLRHSLSFSGFSSTQGPSLFSRASSVSPPPRCAGSPDPLSPGALTHRSYPFSGLLDLGDDSALQFSAVTDSVPVVSGGPGPLWRCSSNDSVCEEGYASAGSTDSESPGDPSRLPIFSRLSITD